MAGRRCSIATRRASIFSVKGKSLTDLDNLPEPDELLDTAGALESALGAQAERRVLQHQSGVTSAVFSPNGARVLTSSDNTARIWDAASGQELAVLRGHEGSVTSAVFSSDGARVITASYDNTARIWETWPTVQALVEEARRRMPRQLTPEQEQHFGLRSGSSGD